MSRLDDALTRFSAALDRLEAEAGQRLARAQETNGSAAELSLLRSEREQLIARIAGLEEESRNLASLTEEVENRLDGAIAEIRDVLGRN
jgi:hypothetical protein